MRLCLLAAAAVVLTTPALANDEFNLTYHVERTPTSSLGLDDCADITERLAQQAGYSAAASRFPGQLVVVRGGAPKVGSFVVHCIAVDSKTVSVVNGTDYRQAKGAMGQFADRVHAEIVKAAQ